MNPRRTASSEYQGYAVDSEGDHDDREEWIERTDSCPVSRHSERTPEPSDSEETDENEEVSDEHLRLLVNGSQFPWSMNG